MSSSDLLSSGPSIQILAPIPFFAIENRCGRIIASNSDIEAWGSLDYGSDATATAKLGLFGYDITCLIEQCDYISDVEGYCSLAKAKGFDGLSFGIQGAIDASDSADADYCVGFRDTEFGDKGACYNTDSGFHEFRGFQGYTIADDYFTNNPSRVDWLNPMFGLYGFFASHSYDTGDVTTFFEFRFIGALENDGARWTSGDSIEVFTLDWNNDVVTPNEGFELLSATHLTAAGATFVAALMLM